jgi:hypothetical protein
MKALLTARRHFDRRFYFGAGLVALGLVFWGFAPSYYPAFGWGGSIALAALNLAYPIAISPQWLRLGTSLVA